MTSSTDEHTRSDGFLGGRLTITQPARGFRSGMDAVLLAAACPARPGDAVLELGCGAGVAILCLGARVPGLRLTGLELQAGYAALAHGNAAENGLTLTVHQGDVAAIPPALRAAPGFDQVIANPPWFDAGPAAPDAGRATARHAAGPLAAWIRAGLRRLRQGGRLTLILPVGLLTPAMAGLGEDAADIRLLPLAPRAGRPASRVILSARKGARGPLRLLAPFVLHAAPTHAGDAEDLTTAAQGVLRGGLPIPLE